MSYQSYPAQPRPASTSLPSQQQCVMGVPVKEVEHITPAIPPSVAFYPSSIPPSAPYNGYPYSTLASSLPPTAPGYYSYPSVPPSHPQPSYPCVMQPAPVQASYPYTYAQPSVCAFPPPPPPPQAPPQP
uniref:Uncharacterized protein n=1 Tax=Lygus hesperus TaxID=30085 RepID=A0A146LLL6_LYGHE